VVFGSIEVGDFCPLKGRRGVSHNRYSLLYFSQVHDIFFFYFGCVEKKCNQGKHLGKVEKETDFRILVYRKMGAFGCGKGMLHGGFFWESETSKRCKRKKEETRALH